MANTYGLSYAGIQLPVCTDEVRNLCARYNWIDDVSVIPPRVSYERENQRWPLAVFPREPRPRLGRFFYPTHAHRWSWYLGVVDAAALAAIQSAVYLPTGAVPAIFGIRADDVTHPDNSGGVSTSMFMLPPRPLGLTNQGTPLYLLHLVDERYFWQWSSVPTVHSAQLTSWEMLLGTVEDAMSVLVDHDPFEPQYLTPEVDSGLYTNYESGAGLLDAIGWNTGRTFVRSYDGTYAYLRVSDYDAIRAVNQPGYRAFGGDVLDPTDSGQVAAWVNAAVPGAVRTTFPVWNKTTGAYVDPERAGFFVEDSYGETYPVNVPLASLPPPYNQFAGNPSTTAFLYDTAKALVTTTGTTPTNTGVLTTLAYQLAADYIGQKTRALDEAFAGIRNWQPDPLDDVVYDYLPPGIVATRVLFKPFNFYVWQMQHAVGVPSMSSSSMSATSQASQSLTPSVTPSRSPSPSGSVSVSAVASVSPTVPSTSPAPSGSTSSPVAGKSSSSSKVSLSGSPSPAISVTSPTAPSVSPTVSGSPSPAISVTSPTAPSVSPTVSSSSSPSASASPSASKSSVSGQSSKSSQQLIPTECCTNGFPEKLYATLLPGQASPCECANGGSFPLTYNGSGAWNGTGVLGSCGHEVALSFRCDGDAPQFFSLSWSFPDDCSTNTGTISRPLVFECDPIEYEFLVDVTGTSTCCPPLVDTFSFYVEVTE